ncbi:hypothetical protein DQE80_15135, partial [Enterococcus sp. HPCN18]
RAGQRDPPQHPVDHAAIDIPIEPPSRQRGHAGVEFGDQARDRRNRHGDGSGAIFRQWGSLAKPWHRSPRGLPTGPPDGNAIAYYNASDCNSG